MVDASIWDKEVAVPVNVISFVDNQVLKWLPSDSTVISITPYGASYWTRTAEIKTVDSTGDVHSFFLKGEVGKGMLYGEFHSMKAIHDVVPEHAPRPVGYGTYESDADTHFFLCLFHIMADGIPDADDLPAAVARLHKNGRPLNNKFGFPVRTFQGRLPQDTTERDTWEECFSNDIDHFFEAEQEAQGFDEEMAALRKTIMEKVIPRLLRPLETGGNTIDRCLVHGDLWDGNTLVDAKTGKALIFDASSSYAHHEYELAPWSVPRHKIGKSYVLEYLKHFPPSEPVADFDDRIALYCVRFNLCSSALYPGNLRFRNLVKEEMRSLIQKLSLV